jgi:predicted DNA-binding transcriptional regulator AlpA
MTTPTAPQAQPGGRTTTTSNGIANLAPGGGPELLTVADAARLLSIGERTAWRWSRSGIMPAPVTIGIGLRPAVRWRRSDLQQWIDAGCPRIDGGTRR